MQVAEFGFAAFQLFMVIVVSPPATSPRFFQMLFSAIALGRLTDCPNEAI
jgi:hypothetical protein